MKRIVLLLLCICAYANSSKAGNVSHDVEFARAYGIIRYFSPNPYTQNWSENDWMKVCALLVQRTERQPLEEVFRPLAPSIFISATPVPPGVGDATPNDKARCYVYSGSGHLDVPFLARLLVPGLADYIPYHKELKSVSGPQDSIAKPAADRYYNYRLAEGKYLHIQHALPGKDFDAKATNRLLHDAKRYWKSHQSGDETLPQRRRFIFGLLSDPSVRIADLVVRWNIIRHFYPYYGEDRLNWDRQLEVFLTETRQSGAIDSYEALFAWYDRIGRFLNPVRDGHLIVRRDMEVSGIQSTYLPEYFADAASRFVNDTLLIRIPVDGQPAWRLVHTIDGQPVGKRMQACRATTNAATDAHRDRMAADKLFYATSYDTPFIVESRDPAGDMHRDTLRARLPEAAVYERDYQPIRKLSGGILYVDATAHELNEKRFLAALTPDIQGICFDLRGLPTYQFEDILAHLIPGDVQAPATEIPINCFPFQEAVSWQIRTETLKAKLPHVTVPMTFLCDAGTVSWGETILMMVRRYGLGKIIGQTTAGTTGDMTHFDLPLFPFSMTGLRMHDLNGEEHHGRGIVPDVTVPERVDDYLSDFDRTLHTALETIQSAGQIQAQHDLAVKAIQAD